MSETGTEGLARAKTKKVCLAGATGTIGQATARALAARGHEVVSFLRPRPESGAPEGARLVDFSDPASLARDGFRGERFDALVSCMASRTGAPKDAWAIDYQAQSMRSRRRKAAGVTPVRAALGDLRAETAARVPARQARLRERR